MPLSLSELVIEYVKSLGATIEIKAGIVYATMPDGKVWDFTYPQIVSE